MFLDELTPVAQTLLQHPIAFLGGFVSGVLRLDLAEQPVKSWLEQQGADPVGTSPAGNSSGPQSISID